MIGAVGREQRMPVSTSPRHHRPEPTDPAGDMPGGVARADPVSGKMAQFNGSKRGFREQKGFPDDCKKRQR